MLAQIKHRGPDEFGIFVNDRLAMGNARLCIVDLAGGIQPISNEAGDIWIVYNGEIFNHLELRASLEQRGHQFSTHTDTEVIVHLYEDLGPGCLGHLNGQWAMAIFDGRRQELLLARDRLGVRPLFYTVADGTLVFGSEVKTMLPHPKVRRSLDPLGITNVFTLWTTLAPRTCFEGIRELPPGHFAIVRNAPPEPMPFWRLQFPSWDPQSRCNTAFERPRKESGANAVFMDEKKAAERLRELLLDSTSIRLRADVPVGAYLSGGVDSSIIAALIRRTGVNQLETFSIAFDDSEFDESLHQREVADFLGTTHNAVRASHADIGRVFPEVVWHTETCLTRTAPAPMFMLAQLVRVHGYKVVLTGEGADEFLGGYDIFKEAAIRRFWAREPASDRRPMLLRRVYPDIARLDHAPAFVQRFFGLGLTKVEERDYSHQIRWRNNARCCRFFTQEFAARAGELATNGREAISYPSGFDSWHPLAKAQFIEVTTLLSGYLLSSQGDRVSMAHAIEGRHPFLDFRVVDFCNNLDPSLKLRGLREKWILREAFKGWLPDSILARRKRPYRAPIHRSFATTQSGTYVDDMLSTDEIRKTGIFNPTAVSLLHASLRNKRTLGETDEMALVGILSTQLLHHQFVTAFRPRDALGPADRVKLIDRRSRHTPATRRSKP